MATRKLALKPGVNVELSPTLNQAQLSQSTLIRYYKGLIQKRSGWQQMIATPLIGRCCGLHGWADIGGVPWFAAGTEQRLELVGGGQLYDITPIVATNNPAVAFSTTLGSPLVTITDATTSPNVGDWVNLTTHVSVGGVVLFGYYQVVSVVGTTQYVVTAQTNATTAVTNGGAVATYTTVNLSPNVTVTLNNHGYPTSGFLFDAVVSTSVGGITISGLQTITSITNLNQFVIQPGGNANASTTVSENGGNAQIQYLLPTGPLAYTATGGFGIGDYGGGDYGLGSTNTVIVPARQWSLDNFGQDLIASPSGGKIYYWQPDAVQPVTVISGSAPLYNTAVLVMSQAQMIIALGAEVGGIQQPLLVRWCDAGDFTDWTATVTNQAGSYTIPQGSTLVGGLAVGLGVLLWTDIGLWQMTYQGLPFVFGFRPVAVGCGLINQRAFATAGSLVMWLGTHNLWLMNTGGGSPQPVECDVWDILQDNADLTQTNQFVMGANELTNEFELFFPLLTTSPYYVAGSVVIGSIKYNYVENVWDYTISPQLQRTAWEHHWVTNPGNVGNPVGADLAGLLQQHEIGHDANGVAMNWSWQTGYFDLMEGEEFVSIDWLIPDFLTQSEQGSAASIQIEILTQNDPQGTPVVVGPFTWQPGTPAIPTFGARGRQAAIQCSGSDMGSWNRLGALRYRFAPDGRGY